MLMLSLVLLEKAVVGIKVGRYVWWGWSHLKEGIASASGLGGTGSQRNGRTRLMVLPRLMEKDRFGACPHWASQVEGDHNKRNNGASQCSVYRESFCCGFFMPPLWERGTHSSILKGCKFFGSPYPVVGLPWRAFWSFLSFLFLRL